MTAFRITAFGGIIPRMAERLLPDNAARTAHNCKLASGELHPLRKARKVHGPILVPPIASMFKADEDTWFTWPVSGVSMSRAPILGAARYCYTGDGEPRVTTIAMGTPVSGTGSPASFRALGIPAPLIKPTTTPSGGTGSAVSRSYLYTFMSAWNEESGPSPASDLTAGKIDDTWAISGMDAAPPNTGSIIGAVHSSGVVTVQTSARHYLRAGDRHGIAGVVGMTSLNSVWTVASVPDSTHYTVSLTTAQTYTSGGTWTRQAPWGTCTKRLYRTSGTAGAFQLVAEGISGTTYNDTLLDTQILGDELISATWEPPPTTLSGLMALPNGSMVGFDGNTLRFAEPYQPHAWPAEYGLRADYPIVGIAAYGTTVVAGTEAVPYRTTGYEPGLMTADKIDTPYPCLSALSVCGVGDGVVYATKGGLVFVNDTGAMLLTAALFSDEDWAKLAPGSMRSAYGQGRLYLFTDTDPARIYILSLDAKDDMVTTYAQAQAVHIDPLTGRLHYAVPDSIYEVDPDGGVPLMQEWWGKDVVLANPANMGAAKVVFSPEYTAEAAAAFVAEEAALVAENAAAIAAGSARGALGAARLGRTALGASLIKPLPAATTPTVTFEFYAGGKLRRQKQLSGSKAFRLPAGYKADTFSVRVMANTHVRSIEIAETMTDLKHA